MLPRVRLAGIQIAAATAVGLASGCASAAFLASLDWVTQFRAAHPAIVWALPLAGLALGWCYHRYARGLESGSNLILEEIHAPAAGVPWRLAPAILLATLATHLFGGSAGREGTAVQMGGSLAGGLGRWLGWPGERRRWLLMAGISGGFASVFGTPLAGFAFGLEVLAIGRLRTDALLPCLVAALVGDWTCSAWGIHHSQSQFAIASQFPLSASVLTRVLLATVAFAAASRLFVALTHRIEGLFKQWLAWPPVRPFVGGLLVLGLVWLADSRDYLGLGIPLIVASFTPAGVATWAWMWKLLFTGITLGSGFKGGEVTPLFCIGAALGCTLAGPLGLPHDFLASIGFVAVFAGCANTPIACTIMGMELFGAAHGSYFAAGCCGAYLLTGHRGIYAAQRVEGGKVGAEVC